VDAVQLLLGCTFGKGNLIFLDHGKQVFSFFERARGEGLRLSLIPGATTLDPRYRELSQKTRAGQATAAQSLELDKLRDEAIERILSRDIWDLFAASAATVELPAEAVVQPSERCARCGEPTMPLKMVRVADRSVCRPCAEMAGQVLDGEA
jgi:formylmethanofuran dehydrogenase subunit E